MKHLRSIKSIYFLALFWASICLTGCSHSVKIISADGVVSVTKEKGIDPKLKPIIIKGIKNGSMLAADNGLKFAYSKNAGATTEAAKALKDNITNQVIPYLNGDQLKFGIDVMNIVDSSLFNKVPAELKAMISLGTVALDMEVTGPNASSWGDQDKLDFIKAAMQGINDGIDAFLADPGAKPKSKVLNTK